MAPEVFEGSYDERADCWSVGVLVHELLPNYYAKNKLAVDVRAPKLGATPFDNSYFQQVAGKKRALTPFESALLADKETKGIVEEYAKSKQAFREDVRGAYAKVTSLGTNYVG